MPEIYDVVGDLVISHLNALLRDSYLCSDELVQGAVEELCVLSVRA